MQNIENMRRQFRTMGATFAWKQEVVTADPRTTVEPVAVPAVPGGGPGLPAMSAVDWCPNDGTLAREQVEGPSAAAGAATSWSRSATSSSGI
jgi:leucyl-tRNA synthetase